MRTYTFAYDPVNLNGTVLKQLLETALSQAVEISLTTPNILEIEGVQEADDAIVQQIIDELPVTLNTEAQLQPIREQLKESLDLWLSQKRQQLAQEAKFTPDKLTEWWWKRSRYVEWLLAGQPALTATDYPGVVIEAYYAGKTPETLINEWGAKNGTYEQMMHLTMSFRAFKRREIAATADRLTLLTSFDDWDSQYEAFLADLPTVAGQPWL